MKRRVFIGALGRAALASMLPVPIALASLSGPKGYLRTNWSQDPFSLGSYSYIPKGVRRSDIKALNKGVNNKLYFAGEAIHPDYNSTVHAAYESGLSAADKVLKTRAKSVAVIGAGISGLGCAHALHQQLDSVTVFEARDRMGGRIWTHKGLRAPLDLGASWIHGIDENTIYHLAEKQQLRLTKTDDDYIVRGKQGRLIEEEDVPDWLENVVSVQHTAGADGDQINASAYWVSDDYDGDEVIFNQGYQGILPLLSRDLDVRMQHAVSAIDYARDTVRIDVTGKGSATYDAVIVTVPLGVLQAGSIAFTPELPGPVQRVFGRLKMGVLDKVYLQYDRVFWDSRATWIATPENGLPQGYFNQWLNLHKYLGVPIIMALNGGPPAQALATYSDERIIEMADHAIRSAY